MLIAEKEEKTSEKNDRRTHLQLSLEERRRQLAEQAEKLALHYENAQNERELWQGGDIIEF